MRWFGKFRERFTGLTNAIVRFPLTSLLLLAAAVINAYSISTEKDHSKFLLTFILGRFLVQSPRLVMNDSLLSFHPDWYL